MIPPLLLALVMALLWGAILLHLVFSIAGLCYSVRNGRGKSHAPEPAEWPGVSILVPARNEESVLAGTLRSLLQLDYPYERMEVIVVDDGSTDGTREIVEQAMKTDRRVRLGAVPPELGGRGKSPALNFATRHASHELIAVYDADNRPEPDALRRLVAEVSASPTLAAAVGQVRTLNRNASLLTRCIAIEFTSFQCMMQAGRWILLRLCSLPGTNFVIRRSALTRVGGWDERAIADDAELTARLHRDGGWIKYIPAAVSWEPEPHVWRAWVRQRLRWARGGIYVVRKFASPLELIRHPRLLLEVLHLVMIYDVLLAVVLVSDLLLVKGLLRGAAGSGALTMLWAGAVVLFTVQTMLCLAVTHEATLQNLLITTLMYFTYCQAWLYVSVKAHLQALLLRREVTWDKTEHPPEGELAPRWGVAGTEGSVEARGASLRSDLPTPVEELARAHGRPGVPRS